MPLRYIAAACAAAISAATLLSAQEQSSDPRRQRFRSGAHYVLVDVYPTRNGRAVPGLTAEDFEILEDGKPQVIDSVEFIEHPEFTSLADRRDPSSQRGGLELARDPKYRVFVVYLDAFHVDLSGSNRASRPLADLLNRMIGTRDLFGVLTPVQSIKDLMLGQLTQSIDEQLAKYPHWGLAGRLEPQPGEAELEFYFADGRRLVALGRLDKVYGDLESLVQLLGDLREERKNIIFVSDSLASPMTRFTDIAVDPDPRGRGNPPGIGAGPGGKLTMGSKNAAEPDRMRLLAERSRLLSIDFHQRFNELLQSARHANVAFYTVRPGGLDAGSSMLDWNISNLQTLAEQTDGLAVLQTNDLRSGVMKIAQDQSSHYVLGYYTGNTRWDGRTRKIAVRLKKSGERVRARREYRAPTEAEMASITDARATADTPAAPSAIETALSGLARIMPVPPFKAYATQLGGEIVVVAEIGAAEIEGGRWRSGGRVDVMLNGDAGATVTGMGRIPPGARGTLIRIPTGKEQGPWQASVRIRGEDGATASDSVSVDISGATIGRPIVYRAASAAAAPFVPSSIFHFRRTERVRVEWPVLQATESPVVRLLDRAGTPLKVPITVAMRESDGRQVISTDLALAPLNKGEYVIELTTSTGGGTDRQLLAIRVDMAR